MKCKVLGFGLLGFNRLLRIQVSFRVWVWRAEGLRT